VPNLTFSVRSFRLASDEKVLLKIVVNIFIKTENFCVVGAKSLYFVFEEFVKFHYTFMV